MLVLVSVVHMNFSSVCHTLLPSASMHSEAMYSLFTLRSDRKLDWICGIHWNVVLMNILRERALPARTPRTFRVDAVRERR